MYKSYLNADSTREKLIADLIRSITELTVFYPCLFNSQFVQ